MKNYVITYGSVFRLFRGFMSYAFIPLMKLSELSDFQIGLVLNPTQIYPNLISYVILIAFLVEEELLGLGSI